VCQRILVVDDDRELRSLLQALLESEGYAVDTACDGQIAWEKLESQPGAYEAVFLDVNLPRMTGLQLIRALRQQETGRISPLVAMSANREALNQAAALGVRHVLEKPFDLEAVLALASTCVA
jgi:CheY-like chemotaxis protein